MHLMKKLDGSKSSYESALKENETQLNEIKTIEVELEKTKLELESHDKKFEEEILSQGISLELRQSQVNFRLNSP